MQSATELHPAGASADAAAEAEHALLDARIMNDWCNDMDREDVVAILARVPAECAKSLAEFEKAMAAGDLAAARRAAHRLKGMANNLGAVRLARMARTIELGCQSIDDVACRMPALVQTLDETLEALRRHG